MHNTDSCSEICHSHDSQIKNEKIVRTICSEISNIYWNMCIYCDLLVRILAILNWTLRNITNNKVKKYHPHSIKQVHPTMDVDFIKSFVIVLKIMLATSISRIETQS